MTTAEEVTDKIKFCIDVILKEAREETRLVRQIFYCLLSMYTNNPVNLAINAPTGEGKNYIIQKVGELFPQNDVIFLAGLSEKALYHRHGTLVVKNPDTGKYEEIDNRIREIDSRIQEKESEALTTEDRNLKYALKNQIKDLEIEKKDLVKDAKKLIDLSYKALVILDTPSPGLFGALMSLLSHDRYEAEYEFADRDVNSGINTRVNILRGWPVVIFAQAVDYSSYKRWPEVQRRFIITNPNMDPAKYDAAIDLMADKFGLPDFAYQTKVVSGEEKNVSRDIIEDIKAGLLEITANGEPGKNNVIIPFITPLNKSLARQKASDMTMVYRLFTYLSLLPQIKFHSRPYIQDTNKVLVQRIPFAMFEDLKESLYLMEFADGVRPYILEWYHKVFLPTFNIKTEPDYRFNSKGEKLEEKKIAVTTEQLATATQEIQNKIMTKQQVRQNYIEPLMNQGYIDKIDSLLDKRSDIYYPVILKIDKLNRMDNRSNFLHYSSITVIDSTIFPDKTYLKTVILDILNKTDSNSLYCKIFSHDKKDITVDELVDCYYNTVTDYFTLDSKFNISSKRESEIFYMQDPQNGVESQEIRTDDANTLHDNGEECKKLDRTCNRFNLSTFEGNQEFPSDCYYCSYNEHLTKAQYDSHIILKHPGKPGYPGPADIKQSGLTPQGMPWENLS